MTDGLFLEAVRSVAQDVPDVELEDLLVDASTAHMVRSPERFDVLCSTNCGDFGRHVAARVAR
jgi:3-isopropylmalate dehydrogenase